MSAEAEVTYWLERLDEQPDEAMHQIWSQYYAKLVGFARRKLADAPRRVADEEDVAVSAIHSFFRAAQNQRFPDLNDRNDLWKVLLTIAARKASHQMRDQIALKRGGGELRGESVFAGRNSSGVGLDLATEPTDGFASLFADELMSRLKDLPEERLQEIAVLKLEGFGNKEIAEKLNCGLRSVERKLQRIRTAWSETPDANSLS